MSMIYEQQISRELSKWKRRMMRHPSITSQLAKSAQTRINAIIPEKVHVAVTNAVKQMVRGVLYGASYTALVVDESLSLEERERLVMDRIDFYKKTAAAEGGLTGMGGILLGLADFPLLLGLKLKLLFDIATYYGYSIKDYRERIYLLKIFQLAFSSQENRRSIYREIENWEEFSRGLPEDINKFDWRTFQLEYRDHIDLSKMAQLLPFVGAVVGFVVNYRLVQKLGDTAMNAYRMRWLTQPRQ